MDALNIDLRTGLVDVEAKIVIAECEDEFSLSASIGNCHVNSMNVNHR